MIRLLVATVSVACLSPLVACWADEVKWTEEVQLQDGRVVQVKRRIEFTSSGSPIRARGFVSSHEFCYPPLGIHWKSQSVYRPHVFDIVDGIVYMRVPVTGCETCLLQGYPPNDQLTFRWEDAKWKKVAPGDGPRLKFNLLATVYGRDEKFDAHGLITLKEKRRRDASAYYVMQKTGWDEPVKPGQNICQKCRSVGVQTSATPEVFLPSKEKTCDW